MRRIVKKNLQENYSYMVTRFGLRTKRHCTTRLNFLDEERQQNIRFYTTAKKWRKNWRNASAKNVQILNEGMDMYNGRPSSIFAVKRITTTNRGTSDETGYYITSKDTDAKELLHIAATLEN